MASSSSNALLPVNSFRGLELREKIYHLRIIHLIYNNFPKTNGVGVYDHEYISMFDCRMAWYTKEYKCFNALYIDVNNLVLTCLRNRSIDLLTEIRSKIRTKTFTILVYVHCYECNNYFKHNICSCKLECIFDDIEWFIVSFTEDTSLLEQLCEFLIDHENKFDSEFLNLLIDDLEISKPELLTTLLRIVQTNVNGMDVNSDELKSYIITCDSILKKLKNVSEDR